MAGPWWVVVANPGTSTQTAQVTEGSKPNADAALHEQVLGPYSTLADATAELHTLAASGAAAGAGALPSNTAAPPSASNPGSQAQQIIGGLAGPFATVQDALTAFYDKLTDGKMWRSLGWLALGIVLLLIGVALWIGPSALRRSPLGIAREALGLWPASRPRSAVPP